MKGCSKFTGRTSQGQACGKVSQMSWSVGSALGHGGRVWGTFHGGTAMRLKGTEVRPKASRVKGPSRAWCDQVYG